MAVNLASVDLRLLVVFDSIMTERNVSRAGRRIGMSQPAMSNALNRLREALKDPLFVRGAGGVRPTPRAVELAAPIGQALRQIERALEPTAFVPAEADRTFTLAVSEHASVVMLPHLVRRLVDSAPGVGLRVQAKANSRIPAQLDSDEIDFAIGVIPELPKRFARLTLFDDRYVCMMRPGHPLARGPMTLSGFAAADHLAVRPTDEASAQIDRMLEKRGLRRRIVMSLSQFLAVPPIVRHSDMVVTLFRRTTGCLGDIDGLHLAPIPLAPDTARVELVWNRTHTRQRAHEWMRHQIVETCRRI